MADKQSAKWQRKLLREQLKEQIDKYRPYAPGIISAIIGWAILFLLFLPYAQISVNGGNYYNYSFIALVCGTYPEYGRLNISLVVFLALMVLAPAVQLVGKRGSHAALIVSTVMECIGIIGILVSHRNTAIRWSFVSGTTVYVAQNYGLIGFWLPLVVFFLYLFVPYICQSISTNVAIRRFSASVKTGKKLLNY